VEGAATGDREKEREEKTKPHSAPTAVLAA